MFQQDPSYPRWPHWGWRAGDQETAEFKILEAYLRARWRNTIRPGHIASIQRVHGATRHYAAIWRITYDDGTEQDLGPWQI
jgi:hypothetical protein